jgi:hypothetical protein
MSTAPKQTARSLQYRRMGLAVQSKSTSNLRATPRIEQHRIPLGKTLVTSLDEDIRREKASLRKSLTQHFEGEIALAETCASASIPKYIISMQERISHSLNMIVVVTVKSNVIVIC